GAAVPEENQGCHGFLDYVAVTTPVVIRAITAAATSSRYQTNQTMEWCATKRSSQAIEMYPTTKLTAIPTRVGVQPTVAATSCRLEYASRAPAAVSAGTPRRNDMRVAVTRSRSRKRPAAMVVPDRDTPGISEKTCMMPMKTPSLTRRLFSCRVCVAARSAK